MNANNVVTIALGIVLAEFAIAIGKIFAAVFIAIVKELR
jgi:hypothetical protein